MPDADADAHVVARVGGWGTLRRESPDGAAPRRHRPGASRLRARRVRARGVPGGAAVRAGSTPQPGQGDG